MFILMMGQGDRKLNRERIKGKCGNMRSQGNLGREQGPHSETLLS